MITMISAKKAISVRLKTNSSDFVIRNLETGEEKVIPMVRLYGPNLKYRGEFERTFLKQFPGKADIVIFDDACQKLEEILYFNRVDL